MCDITFAPKPDALFIVREDKLELFRQFLESENIQFEFRGEGGAISGKKCFHIELAGTSTDLSSEEGEDIIRRFKDSLRTKRKIDS